QVYGDTWYGGGSTTGSYELRVDVARGGTQLESDANYSNDSISGANVLNLATIGTHRSGTIAGTVMASEWGHSDSDYFSLGTMRPGETVFVSCRLPQSSKLQPVVQIRDSDYRVVATAPNPSSAAAHADIVVAGIYYVDVVSAGGEGTTDQYLLDVAIWPTGSLQLADLAVASIDVPTSVVSGRALHVSWTAGNYGTGSTGTATWYDRVVLSSNESYGDGDDIELKFAPHSGPLDVNQEYAGQADVVVPQIRPGNYWVFVQTDATNTVDEYLFENNNVRRGDTQVGRSPVVTVNLLATSDSTPALTGTVNDPAATISVTVGGHSRTAVNNGNGTWTLPDNTITPALARGLYDVQVTATDIYDNAGSDATTNELIVFTVAGDANLDGEVGPEDFALLKDNFGRSGAGVGWGQADFNGDSEVGPEDFALLKDNFGRIVYTVAGDANRDGEVGPEDFAALKDNFGRDGLFDGWAQGDFNGDGEVSPEDFALLKDNFGLSIPLSVPLTAASSGTTEVCPGLVASVAQIAVETAVAAATGPTWPTAQAPDAGVEKSDTAGLLLNSDLSVVDWSAVQSTALVTV
ncbi:MAG: dockerin type I domain-containing protein, partial [Planctomycetota bacterium]|nr:dockerin type I domain-containing protein [Planctomycetota bacterium]